jgi:hypothetical protein
MVLVQGDCPNKKEAIMKTDKEFEKMHIIEVAKVCEKEIRRLVTSLEFGNGEYFLGRHHSSGNCTMRNYISGCAL